MPKFRHRPTVIEAVQWKPEMGETKLQSGDSVVEIHPVKPGDFGPHCFDCDKPNFEHAFAHEAQDGDVPLLFVCPGSWLVVHHPHSRFYTIPDKTFRECYEPL